MKYLLKGILYIMKKILKSILFAILYCYLTVNLILERISKGIWLLVLMLWHFNFKKQYVEMFKKYRILIPAGIFWFIIEFQSLRDYFQIKNAKSTLLGTDF